jgi:hypothetical protein
MSCRLKPRPPSKINLWFDPRLLITLGLQTSRLRSTRCLCWTEGRHIGWADGQGDAVGKSHGGMAQKRCPVARKKIRHATPSSKQKTPKGVSVLVVK